MRQGSPSRVCRSSILQSVFYHQSMDARTHLPLPTLLSHALVAFTVEFDNEAERQMQHRTTRYRSTPGAYGPWLVSMAMWFNCLRFVGEEGVTAGELARLARTHTNLNGMARWGYISVAPNPADKRAKPPRSSWLIHATPAGRKAQEIWRPLFAVIENRWRERFGADVIEQLRASLCTLLNQIDGDSANLPDCMPILGYGLRSLDAERTRPGKSRALADNSEVVADLALPSLLSKVLLAFALEFERTSPLSLAICANVLRLVGDEGVRVRDLPRLSGVSKEAIAMVLSFLQKRGYAVIRAESRVKMLALTPLGIHAKKAYPQLLQTIEDRWESLGQDALRSLRQSLEKLVGDATRTSLLFRGLGPYPEGWRASVPNPEVLPDFPMVLHRGGYPDGS